MVRDDPSIRFFRYTDYTNNTLQGPKHGEKMNHEDDDFDDFDDFYVFDDFDVDSPCQLVLLVLSRPWAQQEVYVEDIRYTTPDMHPVEVQNLWTNLSFIQNYNLTPLDPLGSNIEHLGFSAEKLDWLFDQCLDPAKWIEHMNIRGCDSSRILFWTFV